VSFHEIDSLYWNCTFNVVKIVAGLIAEVEGLNLPTYRTYENCDNGCDCKASLCFCRSKETNFVKKAFTSHSKSQMKIFVH
jgi:hypothetical protein